jgi:pyruvate decarboxylase
LDFSNIFFFLISSSSLYTWLFISLPFSLLFPLNIYTYIKRTLSFNMDTKIGSLDTCRPTSNDMINPTNGAVAAIQSSVSPTIINASESTLGRHLARRLVQIGVNDVFSVPGDFNLTLLDHLIAEPELNLVGCCNELNAGYAADGYARSRGVGACVVTFTVGGLSVLNAIAGAYSENLPVICIVGGPNSNDYGTNRILHHTIGLPDFSQELACFSTVTCFQVKIF